MIIKSMIESGEHAGKEMTIVVDGITRVFIENKPILVGAYATIYDNNKDARTNSKG